MNPYLDLMETAVGAYTSERRADYLARVEQDGIQEHGFGRLAANLGYLLAHSRIPDEAGQFRRIMDVCCRDIPTAKVRNGGRVGNDFVVKEVVLALLALERAGTFPKEVTDAWRADLRRIVPLETYTAISRPEDTRASNWSVFAAASEQLRVKAGLGGDAAFVEEQIANQLKFFDANGMYRDPGCPVVYDMATRLQFAMALSFGYDGPSRPALEENLVNSADATLLMQSASGEIPYGGRSNQFLHNETFFAALCEYYARFFHARGDVALAIRFRRAARRAIAALEYWIGRPDFRHVKNQFPLDSHIGCEGYGYFDKYMVTLGSWAMAAHELVDESVPDRDVEEPTAWEFVPGPDFHFRLMTAGDYTVQFMSPADPHYDACGIGRLQRRGTPPFLGLSVPFATDPLYTIGTPNPSDLAITPGWKDGDAWRFAADPVYTCRRSDVADGTVHCEWSVARSDAKALLFSCTVSPEGVRLQVKGNGPVALSVPLFAFDGERQSETARNGRTLSVTFGGWTCVYTTDGDWFDTGLDYVNRNGRSRRWEARATGDPLEVCVKILGLVS